MKSISIENLNEIVFENRNKNYGAYVLRKGYDASLIRSFFITAGTFTIIALGLWILIKPDVKPIIIPPITLIDPLYKMTEIDISTPEAEVKSKPAENKAPENRNKTENGLIVKDDFDKDDLKDVKKTDNTLGQKNIQDEGKNSNDSAYVEDSHPYNEDREQNEDKKFDMSGIQVVPEFPGGEQMMMKFLANNIVYPDAAKENEIRGTVYLTFIIDKEGNVSDIAVQKGIGGGCEQEAMRVVKAMPKWKPGKNGGKPVKVQYNLPIKFTLR